MFKKIRSLISSPIPLDDFKLKELVNSFHPTGIMELFKKVDDLLEPHCRKTKTYANLPHPWACLHIFTKDIMVYEAMIPGMGLTKDESQFEEVRKCSQMIDKFPNPLNNPIWIEMIKKLHDYVDRLDALYLIHKKARLALQDAQTGLKEMKLRVQNRLFTGTDLLHLNDLLNTANDAKHTITPHTEMMPLTVIALQDLAQEGFKFIESISIGRLK